MPTYEEYQAHAKAKGFQPLSPSAFVALIRCGLNPIANKFAK